MGTPMGETTEDTVFENRFEQYISNSSTLQQLNDIPRIEHLDFTFFGCDRHFVVNICSMATC
jgi:hypothetical protein